MVKARVQKIRGLKLKRDVPVTYLSVAETEARFTAQFAKQVSQEEIDTGVEANKMIGLFPLDLEDRTQGPRRYDARAWPASMTTITRTS